MTLTGIRTPSNWVAALFALFLAAFVAPYYGIRHDSILYLGQVFLRWKPEQFGQDMFFAYGGQAKYTAFPWILATLVEYFPPGSLFKALTIAGRLTFLVASYFLVRELLPKPYRYWGLLAVIFMPAGYGGFKMFSYGEAFLTARSFAEPLVLLTFVAALRSRWFLATALLLIAGALHPLQALVGAVVIWIRLVMHDRRWLHIVWLTLVFLLLVPWEEGSGISLFSRFDSLWLKSIQQSNKQILLREWHLADWCYLLTDGFLVLLVWTRAKGVLAQAASAILLATLMGFVSSFVLVDGLHLVLPAGLQTWRTQWLLHWFAMSTLPWLLWQLHEEGVSVRPRLAVLIAIAIFGAPTDRSAAPLIPLLLIPFYLSWPLYRDQTGRAVKALIVAGMAASLSISFVGYVLGVFYKFAHHGFDREIMRPEYLLLTHPLIAAGIVAGSVAAWNMGWPRVRATLSVLLVASTAYAGQQWDQRNAATRAIEEAPRFSSPFGVELASGAQVLWAEDDKIEQLLATWMMLGRPSYFSKLQTGGVVFSRGTAEVVLARLQVLAVIKLQETVCNTMNALNEANDSCVPDAEAIREVCGAAKGELTYVVMPYKLNVSALGSWTVQDPRRSAASITYFLYGCSDFLKELEPQTVETFDRGKPE